MTIDDAYKNMPFRLTATREDLYIWYSHHYQDIRTALEFCSVTEGNVSVADVAQIQLAEEDFRKKVRQARGQILKKKGRWWVRLLNKRIVIRLEDKNADYWN